MSTDTLTPDDLQKLDIKPEERPTEPPPDISPRKRTIYLSIALVLFLVGFVVAPPSIGDGNYTVALSYNASEITFDITIDSAVGSQSQPSYKTTTELNVSYFGIYPGGSGNSLRFELTILGGDTLQISDLSGLLSGEDISLEFIAAEVTDNTAIFEFTILQNTGVATGLLLAISFLWLTEAIPLAASSLIVPVVLVFLEITGATDALSHFSAPIIFLFLAGFLMAEAMQRTKLDQFISYRIFAFLPPNGKILMFSMMLLAAVFSMFMSNTAACAILIPLTVQLLKGVDIDSSTYRQAMILGIAYASTVGGIGSLIGTPPNIIATELLHEYDPSIEISFVDWFVFGLPVVIIMLPIVFLYLWQRYKPKVDIEKLQLAQANARIQIGEAHPLTQDQMIVSVIFISIFALWLTSNIHGISSSIVAVLGAVLLYMTGHLKDTDLNSINWNALLTFGGGLTLGAMIIDTGLADFIGSKAIFLTDLPKIVIIFTIALIGLVLTAFASNTASAVIMVPIVMPLGPVLGISPILLAVLVAIAASVDFAIVIGTPPTMIAYSTGLYKVKDIFRIGIILDFVGLIVVTLLGYLLFGVFIDIV